MTEPDNTPEFDPATDADAPVEETGEETLEVTPEAPVEENTAAVTPDAPVEENTAEAADPVYVAPEPQVVPQSEPTNEVYVDAPETNAEPVQGYPSSSEAVSDKPVQTDNTERPEDGEQDVSQDPTEVPSEDESPDVVA
jgi:hypothetical protein